MDINNNLAPGKPRAALGPRLRSILSSGNLLGLAHHTDHESKPTTVDDWPDLVPIYDETTISPGSFDQWLVRMRNRLWHYDQLPLNASYNGPLLRMVDDCIQSTAKIRYLEERIVELEKQNQEFQQELDLRVNQQDIRCENCSHQNSQAWINSLPTRHARAHSNAMSNNSEPIPWTTSNTTPRRATESMAMGTSDLFLPSPRFARTPQPYASSSGSSGQGDLHLQAEEQLKERQQAALSLSNVLLEKSGDKIEEHYVEVAQIVRLPTTMPGSQTFSPDKRSQSSGSEEQGDAQQGQHSRPIHQRRASGGARANKRIFSFYPGDDNTLDSLNEYAVQELPPIRIQTPSLEAETVFPADGRGFQEHSQHSRPDISREVSGSSVVTVLDVAQNRSLTPRLSSLEGKTVKKKAKNTSLGGKKPGKNDSRSASRASQNEDSKPQGPLAAAIAATARLGKGGKKTVRSVTPGN